MVAGGTGPVLTGMESRQRSAIAGHDRGKGNGLASPVVCYHGSLWISLGEGAFECMSIDRQGF